MKPLFEHEGNTLTLKDGKFPSGGELVWLLDSAWKAVKHGIKHDDLKKLPTGDLLTLALGEPALVEKALSWVTSILSEGDGPDQLTWDVTQALGKLEDNPAATTIYQSIMEPRIPSQPNENLKEFVLGMVDGRIFSSAHMTEGEMQNLEMVFMPLALGGLAVPSYAMPPRPPNPVKPTEPVKPEYPEQPEELNLPPEPEALQPDAKVIEDLEMAIRFNREVADAIPKYKAKVAEESAQKHRAWEAQCETIRSENREVSDKWEAAKAAVDLSHAKALKEFKTKISTWEVDHTKQLEAVAAWEEQRQKQFHQYVSQIGVFWEWYAKAGPRSINGMPIFFSVSMLNQSDWNKCRKALIKEQERRKDLDNMFDE